MVVFKGLKEFEERYSVGRGYLIVFGSGGKSNLRVAYMTRVCRR